jgi:uncharacterized protein
MFGIGLGLQVEGAQYSGIPFAAVYRRRLLILFVIGMFHGIFLYPGDILAFYAIVGLIAFLFRKFSKEKLWKFFIALNIVAIILAFLGTVFLPEVAGVNEPDWDSLARERAALLQDNESTTDD